MNSNGGFHDIYAYDAKKKTAVLVSRSAADPLTGSDAQSSTFSVPFTHGRVTSDDGRTVVFSSVATNIVSGFTETNGVHGELYVFGP